MKKPSLESVKQKIDQLDLSQVIKKLCYPPEIGGYNWPKEEALKVCQEYRRFLVQCYIEHNQGKPATPPPSTVVDIFWHMHILFTRKYHQDCDEIFGFYLHHDPTLDPRF